MESNFIKFNFEKAVHSKRDALNTQLHMIYAREHIKNFVRLKKQELIIKNKIKDDIKYLKNKINSVISHFPKKKETYKEHVYNYASHINFSKRRSGIESELIKIKEDLERLEKKIN